MLKTLPLALVATALVLSSCASRAPVIRARLEPLTGKLASEVNAALCDTCKASRNGRQLKCTVFMTEPTPTDPGCGGRHSKVKVLLDDAGRLVMWEID